jgi:hypothetical protein
VIKKWSLLLLLGLILGLWGVGLAQEDLLITDFEKHPNYLGGQVGVYGAGEPDWSNKEEPYSWYYTPEVKGYKKENVVSGQQSFRLVNGNSPKTDAGWASFGLDLGPVIDATAFPIEIKSLDVTGYKYLSFWAKGEKGGEKLKVNFRDARAVSYNPQYQYEIKEPLTTEWKRIIVPLNSVYNVDFENLVHVGLAFGEDLDNELGTIIYVDDFAFTNNRLVQ